jgi:peptidoglycan/LPS O-acetylase OafA/YrhL
MSSASGESGARAGLAHRPDIQGLRALAVLLVVAYHAGDLIPGGFVGVDVFLVISGFVIVRGLVNERLVTGRISLRSFAARRVRRLLPLLVTVVAVVVPISLLVGPVAAHPTAARTGAAALVSLANVKLMLTSGYTAQAAELDPFLHMWSLSVEEQFYVVLPALVALLAAGAAQGSVRVRLIAGMAVVAAASLGASLWLDFGAEAAWIPAEVRDSAAFLLMPSRAWQFLAGALLAVVSHDRAPVSRRVGRSLSAVGCIALVVASSMLHDTGTYPGVAGLLPTLGAVALIASAGQGLPMLSRPLAVRLGDMSYGWYLWHWPFMVVARANGVDSAAGLVVVGLLAAPVAAVTYRHVEQRFRGVGRDPASAGAVRGARRALRHGGARVGCALAGVMGLAAILVLVGLAPHPGEGLSVVREAAAADDDHADRSCDQTVVTADLSACVQQATAGAGAPHVVLLGDSNASHISEAVALAARRNGWRLTTVIDFGCPMLDVDLLRFGRDRPQCDANSAAARAWLWADPPDVIVRANASELFLGGADGWSVTRGALEGAAAYQAALRVFLKQADGLGIPVVLVHPVPKLSVEERFAVGAELCSMVSLVLVPERCGLSIDRQEAQDARSIGVGVEQEAATQQTILVDLFDALCPADPCREREHGIWLYQDERHLSVASAAVVVGPLEAGIVRALAGAPG